jgi:hypothetical protein
MYKLFSIVSIFFAISTSASAAIVSVRACGVHNLSTTGKHYIAVTSGQLRPGSYEVFATHQQGANALDSMKNGQRHCIEGSFSMDRPAEGIAINFVK